MNGAQNPSTRELVLQAAVEVLQEVGFNRLRTTDVARQSGLSEGSLFHYFPTRNLLVAAAVDRSLNTALETATATYSALEPPFERRAMMQTLWQLLASPQLTWLNEVYAAIKTDPELRALVGPAIDASAASIEKFASSVLLRVSNVDPNDATPLAEFLILTIEGLVASNLARGKTGGETELIEHLLFFVNTMYPQVAAA
jgi:AcrR family transcriptional regulator